MKIQRSRDLAKLLSSLMLLVCGIGAHAAIPPPTLVDMSGTTLDIAYTGEPNAFYTVLEHRVGTSGSWNSVASVNGASGTTTLNNLAPGAHQFRTQSSYFIAGGFEPIDLTSVSAALTVTVNAGPAPVLDKPGEQNSYGFRVRIGDINSDGRSDVHIQRISGGDPDNGVLQETIITQNADKTFSVLSATSSQLQTGRGWPARSVELKISDYDNDYYSDVMLIDLDDHVSGVWNQIVFSSGQAYVQQAKAVRAVDEEFTEFIDDINGWALNPAHFAGAILPSIPGYRIQVKAELSYCTLVWGIQFCASSGVQTLYDETFSLADLGLENYFGSSSNQKSLARQSAEPDIMANGTNGNGYQTYYCVAICGYYFVGGWDFLYLYQWWDIWTPVTIGSGFDSQNFDRDAYDVSLILDVARTSGNGALSTAQMSELSSIFSSQFGFTIPFPGQIPIDLDIPGWIKGVLGPAILEAILSIGAAIAVDKVNEWRPIFHYTHAGTAAIIVATGKFDPPNSPLVYFTHIIYPNGAVAQELLALCGPYRDTVISMQQSDLPPLSSASKVGPVTCPDGTNPKGGGWEQTKPKPVSLPASYLLIPLPENF